MNHHQERFSGLGTTIEGDLIADDAASQAAWQEIRQRIEAFERRFSRFRSQSELSQLNARHGQPTRVSRDMLDLLRVAREMWNWTAGTVDPLIGGDLVAAGYRRSFTLTDDEPPAPPTPNNLDVAFGDVVWDDDGLVTIPAGSMLDFGGLGKGYLADQLGQFVRQTTTTDFWVSLGGDIIVSGVMPDGRPWPMRIQDQRQLDQNYLRVTCAADTYGVATSSTQARRGVQGTTPWHHLIDPASNAPATTDVLGVTIFAPTALQADVAAKTAVIRKYQPGLAWIESQPTLSGVFFPATAEPKSTSRFSSFVTPA